MHCACLLVMHKCGQGHFNLDYLHRITKLLNLNLYGAPLVQCNGTEVPNTGSLARVHGYGATEISQ